ncbi:hypothetical protein [Pinibacter soli]|uniref:Uncharacterized protein n=1 Tax=Pinibacter soli TaxID=3044211 RepID=A0ABT6RCI2_9BACT|nr:hypothetical protein [Pinibacter soli]MDI3320276.1 hypothetical protein [Pinibacter soli]
MMKFTAIFFLIIIAATSFNKVVVLADYMLNKKYIATVLCENKARPMMHCNGKCHLRKQLQKEEDQQKKEGQSAQEKFEVQFCNIPSFISFEPTYSENSINHNSSYSNSYAFTVVNTFFHPPSFA